MLEHAYFSSLSEIDISNASFSFFGSTSPEFNHLIYSYPYFKLNAFQGLACWAQSAPGSRMAIDEKFDDSYEDLVSPSQTAIYVMCPTDHDI